MKLSKVIIFATALAISAGLSACADLGIQLDTPQERLDAAKTAVAVLKVGYGAVCGMQTTASYCTDPAAIQAYNDTSALIDKAIATAQDAINGEANIDPNDANAQAKQAALIEQLVEDAEADVVALSKVIDDINAKKAAATTPPGT